MLRIYGKECEIVKRLNRFVVEVKVEGRIHKAHINNTGRLEEYLIKGRKAYCIEKEGGKTSYRLFAVHDMGKAALIDTQFQMKAFEQALQPTSIPWLKCKDFKRNQRLNDSLIDYLFLCPEHLYLEVKSAALRQGEYAMYPDCPSLRGRRHISELTKMAQKYKTCILFIAAVPGVKAFKPNREADGVIAELLKKAVEEGVEVRAINIVYDPEYSSVLLLNRDLPTYIDF